jgi:hypothetical protein
LETGYTLRCVPILSSYGYDVSSGEGWLQFEQPFPGGWSEQSFVFGTTAGQPVQKAVVVRVIAHALLNMLPDRGIYEAFESLTRMRDYYAVETTTPLLPEKREPRRLKARITGRVERPAIHIDSD